MKHDTGKRSLEGLKVFPYVAWVMTAGFAFFVYNITSDLQAVTQDLQAQTKELQQQVHHGDPQADFDTYAEQRYDPTAE